MQFKFKINNLKAMQSQYKNKRKYRRYDNVRVKLFYINDNNGLP